MNIPSEANMLRFSIDKEEINTHRSIDLSKYLTMPDEYESLFHEFSREHP